MRYSTPTTSFAAAVDNLPRAGTQKARILQFLKDAGDATREEIENYCGLSGNAVRPRVRELQEEGHVEETERTRTTRSGSQAAVLIATNVGSSTKGRNQPVTPALGVASGVERLASPSGDAPPESVHRNPYEAEVWAD